MPCKACFVCRPVSRIWHRYHYPPWIMGTTVTISPSCTRDSLASKMDESMPFTTTKILCGLKAVPCSDADLSRNETISFMDVGCFSYVKEEHPIIFLQLPSSWISIKNLYLCLSDSRLKALYFHDPIFSSISWLGGSMASSSGDSA
jgi:hypothetical protein